MMEDYRSALRAGQRAYRASVARGQSPYLAVLDEIIADAWTWHSGHPNGYEN